MANAVRRIGGRWRNQRGLTLIELMVVVAIIGILSGVATVSHLSHLPHKRLMGAVNEVMSDMRYARAQAAREGKHYMVCFYPGTSTMSVARVDVLPLINQTCTAAGATIIHTDNLAARFPGVTYSVGDATRVCPGATRNLNAGFMAVNFGWGRAVFNDKGSSITLVGGNALDNTGAVYLTNRDGTKPETFCVRVLGAVGTVRVFQWLGGAWV